MSLSLLDKADNARFDWAINSFDDFAKQVRLHQSEMWTSLAEFMDTVETDGGKLVFSATNLSKVSAVARIVSERMVQTRVGFFAFLRKALKALKLLFEDYFAEAAPGATTGGIWEDAISQTMLRWGFDTATDTLIPGGYFHKLFTSSFVADNVAQMVNRAIASRMSLKVFRQTFKSVLVGKPGEGMLERYFAVNTFDLFQRVDRSVQLGYAEKLGLDNAIYSGTLIKTSRPFCEARVGKVFSREEIAAWADLEFDGKPKIYDPFTDCGGFSCRHHLSWISNELAAIMAKNASK